MLARTSLGAPGLLLLLAAAPFSAGCGATVADPVVDGGNGGNGGDAGDGGHYDGHGSDGTSGDAQDDGPPTDGRGPCEHLPANDDGGPIDAAGIPDATNDAGNYPQAYCNTVCPNLGPPGAWTCQPDGDGGVRCVNCTWSSRGSSRPSLRPGRRAVTLLPMRILYGVVGEGMGHATRSKTTLEWLVAHGHHVKVVVSNRAYGFLDKELAHHPRTDQAAEGQGAVDVVEIRGLTMKYVDNAFDDAGSVLHNVLRAPGMIAENVGAYYDDVVRWKPNAVISDFDSFAYLFAKVHRLPILSIDNQQVMQRCEIPEEAKDLARASFNATKAFVKAKLPGCDHYVITGFFYPPIREKFQANTTLVPPILRPAILAARPTPPTEAKHFLVYQTSKSDTTLIPTLNAVAEERFVVYGLGRDETVGNCVLKPFSEQGFVDDLAAARGVISNGGLSLLNEAVSLHKPVFSVPVKNQYEQLLNAYYLQALGYGVAADEIGAPALRAFVGRLPELAANVARFAHDANAALFATVARVLEEFEGRAFHAELRRR